MLKSNSDSTPGKKAIKSSEETCDNTETKFSKAKRKINERNSSSDLTTSSSSVTPVISSKTSVNNSSGSGGSRKARCMSCPACVQADCRVCKYCVDMKKYGGPGVKKQSCELRPKCQSKVKKSKQAKEKRKSM